jgi:hypothetical protein
VIQMFIKTIGKPVTNYGRYIPLVGEKAVVMKSKGVDICVLIAVWCIVGLLVDGNLTNRAAAQSRAEPINIQWEKIGVMPFFKGRWSADTGETLTCPICELSFRSENVKDGADGERCKAGVEEEV